MAAAPGSAESATLRAIGRRVLPLPFLLGLVSILDRTNISYAALEMNADLGFSATVYGLGAGILFLGYFLFEVPSNLALQRFGARRWLARIAVSWGVIAAAMALVHDETVFYLLRFLLGVAEAGLFPGVVLYLTYWFPARHRARATGWFMRSVPVASILGGPLSGWLDGVFGLSGWQFLFVVQGLPAVALGVVLWRLLPGTPAEARWLTAAQRAWLSTELAADAATAAPGHRLTDALRTGRVWAFTAAYFCYAIGEYGLIFFLPQIVRRMHFTDTEVGFVGAVPFLVGAAAMVLVARSSDRTGERRWHFAGSMLVMAAGLLGAALSMSVPPVALGFLVLVGVGAFGALGTFWPAPTALLTGTAAAAGIAVVNSIGNIAGFAGPYAMGYLVDRTGGFLTGLVMLAVFAAGGAAVYLAAARPGRRA
ncbi:MFS transporter [Actinocatenispora rupis]|uniref:MFS transporter n=1 Tax=Actinocatenispora rupis TaxID=519421 RepID=A0A8J3JCQ3_9ACTN|nr:MFS transporter [Actinocatenispora rupis]GID15916.1 MFS transporter [Actinocatenispora rupis]